jgi:peptidoglycan/xylan/chitin deacetylase (PgdA/CDA1 family)
MAKTCYVSVTVNLHGTSVERRDMAEEMLFGKYSYGKYMAAVGASRLFAMLQRQAIPTTVFVPGSEAERHAALVRDIEQAGHEVAAHGWAMEEYGKDDAADTTLLTRTHDTLTRLLGAAPAGWRAPHGRLSSATLTTLSRLGYRWDSSFQDDDFPYALDADGGTSMIEVPQTEMLVDATLWGLRATHDRLIGTWREEIAALHAERCFISLTLHPRSDNGTGRASRVAAMEGLLAWLKGLPDVTFVTCGAAAAAAREGRLFLRR